MPLPRYNYYPVVEDDELLSLRVKRGDQKLYGRDAELLRLHAAYQRVCHKSCHSDLQAMMMNSDGARNNNTANTIVSKTTSKKSVTSTTEAGTVPTTEPTEEDHQASSTLLVLSSAGGSDDDDDGHDDNNLIDAGDSTSVKGLGTSTATGLGLGVGIGALPQQDESEELFPILPQQKQQHPSQEQQQQQHSALGQPAASTTTATNKTLLLDDSSSQNNSSFNPFSPGCEVVLITGPSGTGKSALVYKFLEELEKSRGQDYFARPMSAALLSNNSVNNSNKAGEGDVAISTKNVYTPNLPCYFLCGKFEELVGADNPYSAFVEAFSGFCATLLQEHRSGYFGPTDSFTQTRLAIQKAVGSEGKVLTDVIPDLVEVIGEQPESSHSASKENGLYRLKYVFRNFLQAIGHPHRPICLFVDDLQNADDASLDLIDTILNDHSLQHLLFIGSFRTNDTTPTISCNATVPAPAKQSQQQTQLTTIATTTRPQQPQMRHMSSSMSASAELSELEMANKDLSNIVNPRSTTTHVPNTKRKSKKKKGPAKTTEDRLAQILEMFDSSGVAKSQHYERIDLQNLAQDTIRQYLWDTLDLPAEDTEELTDVMHQQTRGNIFYLLQSLDELQRKRILTYSQTSKQWDLDVDALDQHHSNVLVQRHNNASGMTENQQQHSSSVLEVVADKIRSLPPLLQQALSIAAFIRSTFDIETLQDVLHMEWHHQFEQQQKQKDGETQPQSESTTCSSKESSGNEAKAVSMDLQELTKLLDIAVVQDLLKNAMGSKEYRFTHDRIQEAAYNLVEPKEERRYLRLRIGKKLVALSKQKHHLRGQDEWMLFVAADHFNSVSPFPADILDPAETAALNLHVGESAASISAFRPASKYLRQGLKYLRYIGESPSFEETQALNTAARAKRVQHASSARIFAGDDEGVNSEEGDESAFSLDWAPVTSSWRSDYDLTLRLYRASADMEFVLGHHNFGMKLSQQIFIHAKTLQDKLPTYLALSDSLGRLSRHQEAVDWNLDALNRLGHFPRRFHFLYVVINMRAVKLAFRKYTDYEILMLPKITDPELLATMEILMKMCTHAWFCGKKFMFVLCILKALRLTFRHGICGYSAQALASYGLILAAESGDEETSLRMARLARHVLDDTKAKHVESSTKTIIASFIEAWSVPLSQVMQTFEEGRVAGLETGNLEFAYFNWVAKHLYSYAAGNSLRSVEKEVDKVIPELKQFSLKNSLAISVTLRELLVRLQGRTTYEGGKKLTLLSWQQYGEAEAEEERSIASSGTVATTGTTNATQVKWSHWGQLQLSYYLGDLAVAEQNLVGYQECGGGLDTSYVSYAIVLFFTGLTVSGLARQTGDRKYKMWACKSLKKMKACVRRCGLNSLHRLYIMEADYAMTRASTSFKGKCHKKMKAAEKEETNSAFERAISAATAAGITQDIALANELAGDFFCLCGDYASAKPRFIEARNHYHKWGAKVKLNDLMKKRAEFLEAISKPEVHDDKPKQQVVSFALNAA